MRSNSFSYLGNSCISITEEFKQIFLSRKSSRSQMFFNIGVLKIFANFIGKHLYWSLFLIKLPAKAFNFIEKRLKHRCFAVKFTKFLRTPFSTKHLWWLLLESASTQNRVSVNKQFLKKKKIPKFLNRYSL